MKVVVGANPTLVKNVSCSLMDKILNCGFRDESSILSKIKIFHRCMYEKYKKDKNSLPL